MNTKHEDLPSYSLDKWIANTELALRLWRERVKPEHVIEDLHWWRDYKPGCGTQACFGGWLVTWPEFQAMGVREDRWGVPSIGGRSPISGGELSFELFGTSSLFSVRGVGSGDSLIPESWNGWQVVECRLLKNLLRLHGQRGQGQ
jgi:hypothetical protein